VDGRPVENEFLAIQERPESRNFPESRHEIVGVATPVGTTALA
jgi:hypothetical protein